MRRILLVLTVAALMAAMVVSAGPAKVDVDSGSIFASSHSKVGNVDFGGVSFNGADLDDGDLDIGDDLDVGDLVGFGDFDLFEDENDGVSIRIG